MQQVKQKGSRGEEVTAVLRGPVLFCCVDYCLATDYSNELCLTEDEGQYQC